MTNLDVKDYDKIISLLLELDIYYSVKVKIIRD